MITAALVALFAMATTGRVGANQSGDPVGNSTAQAQVCRALGGTVSIDIERTVGSGVVGIWTKCVGGLADGLECSNAPSGTICWFNFIHLDKEITVPTTGEVEQVEVAPEPTPETVDERVEAAPAEEPVDDVQPTDPVEDPSVDEPEIIDEVVEPGPVEEPAPDVTQPLDDIVVEPGLVEEPAQDEPPIVETEVIVSFPDTVEDPAAVNP